MSGADDIDTIVPDRDFLVMAPVKEDAGGREDRDFSPDALDMDDMVLGIDPALRLNFNAFICHAGIAVGPQTETDGLQGR